MATISPVRSKPAGNGIAKVLWETLTESDTAAADVPSSTEPVVASVQVTGTFGGATVVLQGSNDGSTYFTLKDTAGSDISFTAAGAADFSVGCLQIRPSASGGSGQDVDVTVIYRG